MSQVNNPRGWSKTRPQQWFANGFSFYVDQLENFARQVYDNLTGINLAKSFTVAELPDAADFDPVVLGRAAYIYVSDESGGATLAFSDGTDWRRVQDRAIVS